MAHTIYASFADAALAERAAGALLDHGAVNEDISLISRELPKEAPSWFPNEAAEVREPATVGAHPHGTVIDHSTGEGDRMEFAAKQGISVTTPGDAAEGALTGAGVGLGVGAVALLASIMIPGVGLVTGGGALATALAGAAGATAAGAVAGGVTGYLKDQGVPDTAAVDYSKAVENGGALLTVETPTGELTHLQVEDILRKYRAGSINAYGSGMS